VGDIWNARDGPKYGAWEGLFPSRGTIPFSSGPISRMLTNKLIGSRFPIPAQASLILGLAMTPFVAKADLPREGFPLGRPDLKETRTVEELRPGLTHVHIERGAWPKEGPPKVSFSSSWARDRESLMPFQECLEQAGYTVREHQFQAATDVYYILFAGEFNTREEAREAARKLPCKVGISTPAYFPDWDTGPWTIDIVIVDPKLYRGKVVSAWSGTAIRESPLELARKRNAVVAINGSWFGYSIDEVGGVPSGISIVEGRWHHEAHPPANHAAMMFLDNTDGRTTFSISYDAPPFPELKWASGNKSIKLDGIDRMPKDNELVAMSPLVADSTPLSHVGPSWLMQRQVGDDGYLVPGDFVDSAGTLLLATGDKQKILQEATVSGPVVLDLGAPNKPGLNAWYTARPLIYNGQVLPLLGHEGDYVDYHSRTALGADADGKIYLISIDGTSINRMVSKGGRFGTTMAQLQDVAKFLRLVNAGDLDGGLHSTSMVIDGKVMGQDPEWHMTTPYDDDRRVADMVIVIDDPS